MISRRRGSIHGDIACACGPVVYIKRALASSACRLAKSYDEYDSADKGQECPKQVYPRVARIAQPPHHDG